MANPFPGVDPFIEASGRWPGFHNTLIAHCSELLNASLPRGYAAMVDERLELVDVSDKPPLRHRRPDVAVVHRPGASPSAGPSAAVLDLEPTTVTLPEYEEIREAFIEIVALPSRELVTSIEILSPTNKSKKAGGEYLAKRAAMLRGGVNLVEIDLLLSGDRLPAREPLPAGDFYAFISRGNRRPNSEVYSWSIRRQLPKLPIPLKAEHADVILDLPTAFDMTHVRGRYDETLQYDLPPHSSLSESDQHWITERIAAMLSQN